jgi:predicted RecA/RadA family phage recombinase
MAYELISFKTGTLVAGADLSALQYTFVTLDAAGKVVANTTNGGKVLGVLQNKPTAGLPCEIVHEGICPVLAGAAIASCGTVMSNASGKAIASATTGSTIVGYALETAAAANEVISVLVNCGAGVV